MPIEHIKVVLSAIDQLVMGDKRRLRFASCGSASNIYFAVAAANGGGAGGDGAAASGGSA